MSRAATGAAVICAKSPASRSLARSRGHRRFVPHPSVCFLHVVFSLFSQQPMMSLQLCSSSPRNPEAFRRLFRRVLTDVCSEVCSIVDSRFSFFCLALPPLLLHPRLEGEVGGVDGCGVGAGLHNGQVASASQGSTERRSLPH